MAKFFTEDNISKLLDEAIEKGLIVPYYQPKYDSVTGKLSGSEALARWIDEEGCIIPPNSFIPILEDSCLITKLDWYILEKVCAFIRKQLDNGITPVTVSVNFSRVHTYESDFVGLLCGIVDKYKVPHKYIEVEITESALTKGRVYIIDFISRIRSSGFAVAIDDFGSGLSSLNFLKDVPATVLKIDKSLLSGNCENEKERIVLESIFNFAQRLNLVTVAEGVETKEQLGFLRTCGCELIQGFYFCKPVTQDEYYELCRKNMSEKDQIEDILITQPQASATKLLLDAVFMCFPLIIMSNLSRNSFYMMAYENFTTRSCSSAGEYTKLIEMGTMSMHPDDRKAFADTFDIKEQLDAFAAGERRRRIVTRQLGDDGVYRKIETINYYVQNPSSDDVLAITLSRTLEN